MDKTKLIEGWRLYAGGEPVEPAGIPESAEKIRLPYDTLPRQGRDFLVSGGIENSYYATAVSYFYKELPPVKKAGRVFLELEGVRGDCDIYIDGRFIMFTGTRAVKTADITKAYQPGALLCLRICTNPDTGKYTGNGIMGGVSLYTVKEKAYVVPGGVRIRAKNYGEKTQADVFVECVNENAALTETEITVEVYNEKQKRIVKKQKRVKLPANGKKIFTLSLKIPRAYEWTNYDPYLYTCAVSLALSADEVSKIPFGVASHEILNKAYRLNGKAVKLKGVVMPHDNGFLGAASEPAAEYRKLSAIKEIGYNAVRYIGCPSETVLDTLDRLGLLCVVDIFDGMQSGCRSGDGHGRFMSEYAEIVADTVKKLRNHPCVAFYSVANDAEECYGRLDGYALIRAIVEKIRELDPDKPLTANAGELVPYKSELERFDIKIKGGVPSGKQAIVAAREKDLFYKLTEEYFSAVDVAGYSHLYPRFATDKGRYILGLADNGAKAFDVFDETDKNPHVFGSFLTYGSDFLGSAKTDVPHLKPLYNTGGDLDVTGRRKSISYLKEILLGKRNSCYITVQDPDAADPDGSNHTDEAYALWNWPKHIGKPVKVVVYTGGEIVALYLDGKQIGRKLAGKFNNYMAVFKTNFYPGKLEAVSFHKGVENARCVLETVTQPKGIKLECATKNIGAGECAYVDISITDKEGRVVPYAAREVEITVLEQGEFVAAGNADPYYSARGGNVCRLYDGRATAVVRGSAEGKIIVKVTGEGLAGNKITLKVKP